MAAITGIVFKRKVVLPSATGLIGEVWQVPASTAGDTQTLTLPYIRTVVGVIGILSHTAQSADNSIACTTLATVAASNFSEVLIVGTK